MSITRKFATATLLTLVAVAALVPTAQARFSIGGRGQSSQVQAATVSDVAAIQARWHNVGYHTSHRVALPSGFTRHKGSIGSIVHSPTQIPALAVKQTGSSSFTWTPVAVGSVLIGMLGIILLIGRRIVRSRRRLAIS